MSLSWIKRPKPPTSVDELVAAGKYRKAIDLLRGQFSQRYPSTTERQGYAELLVRAGRGAEAVPVLLGIADEQERYGFPDKALEALRCAAAIDPEQAEVKERLESIRSAGTPAPATDPPSPPEDPPGAVETNAPADGAPSGEAEFVALDAESPDSVAPDEPPKLAETEERRADVVDPRSPDDEQDLVVVDVDDAVTTTSPRAAAAIPGPDVLDPIAEDDEITATSIRVEPETLGPGALEPVAEDDEITATSIRVEPETPDADALEPVAEDGEITATSIRVEPETPGPDALDPVAEDDEVTATSIRVEPETLGPDALDPVAEEDEITATNIRVDPGLQEDEQPEPPDLHADEPEALEADGELPSLLTDEDLDAALTADAQALLSGGPAEDEPGPPGDDRHFHNLLTSDARALLSDHPTSDDELDDGQLEELLATDARVLLSDGPKKDGHRLDAFGDSGQEPTAEAPAPGAGSSASDQAGPPPTEGKLDETPARNHAEETPLFLSEDDLLGALVAGPEPSSTSTDELDRLVLALAEAGASGTALHSLPSETPDPLEVATALRTRYGSCDWSARVRLHLSGLMLEAGRADDALDTLTGVAEDLAQQGHGRGAIAILKKAGRLRHRGSIGAADSGALREGTEALLTEAAELADCASPAVEEEAESPGQEQGNQLAG